MSMTVQHLSLSLTRSMTHTFGWTVTSHDDGSLYGHVRTCFYLNRQKYVVKQTKVTVFYLANTFIKSLVNGRQIHFCQISFLTLKSEKTEESFSHSWDKAPHSSEAAHPPILSFILCGFLSVALPSL